MREGGIVVNFKHSYVELCIFFDRYGNLYFILYCVLKNEKYLISNKW